MSIRTTLPLAAATAIAVLSAASPALAADRDHDGMSDRWERVHHVNSPFGDPDHDGLNNRAEFRAHTNPRRADTDHDGLADGAELRAGDDPRKRDSDGDGVRDGREKVGGVASFADGLLTITLLDGTTVTATVDDNTEMRCDTADGFRKDDAPEAPVARVASHGSQAIEDESGDDGSGSGDRQAEAVDGGTNGSRGGPSDATAPTGSQDVAPASDNSGPGNANGVDSHACPVDLTGATVRKAEILGTHVEKLELVVRP